jgi:hypothetical protein
MLDARLRSNVDASTPESSNDLMFLYKSMTEI